jgi:hypothetical protein
MERRFRNPVLPGSRDPLHASPADAPPGVAPLEIARGPLRDDDEERRRVEMRVMRFLMALYPQLR